jgi:hypothetical protein
MRRADNHGSQGRAPHLSRSPPSVAIPMKNIIAAFVLAISASIASGAPASSESVETLLALTKAKELVDAAGVNLEQSIQPGMRAAIGKAEPTAEQKQLLDSLPAKLAAKMQPEFNWDVLKPEFVRMYSETFTQEEVDGLIQFYRSPLGVALIQKMPLVVNRCMQITQARLAAVLPKLQPVIAEAIAAASQR